MGDWAGRYRCTRRMPRRLLGNRQRYTAAASEITVLEALARNWRWLLFRSILAASYGLAAIAWPDLTLDGFVYLFGLYAVFDGMVTFAVAIDVKALQGFGSLLFEAAIRIGGGLVAMGEPGIIIAFPRFFAVWAILTGIAEAIVAIALRSGMVGEWPLPLAATVSVVIALLLLLSPTAIGVPALRWLVAPYALIFGVTLVVFTRRLYQIAQEMDTAVKS
jgi:uncharacterized membrane protein HdeD (DUF308 family)